MPSKKISIILILCVGVVSSIWLVERGISKNIENKNAKTDLVVADSYINTSESANNDWQKILIGLSNSTTTVLTNKNSLAFDETTLTAQIARDLFSRYLLSVKSGNPLDSESAVNIVDDVMSTPNYTKTTGVQYIVKNLKVTDKTDKVTVENYNKTLTDKLKERTPKKALNPATIMDMAMKTENEKELSKLDPLILNLKGIVSDLLIIEVPNDAVEIHLNLLNTYSNLLSNIESMRLAFKDPIKSFVGISQYGTYIQDLEIALSNINAYFEKKLGN